MGRPGDSCSSSSSSSSSTMFKSKNCNQYFSSPWQFAIKCCVEKWCALSVEMYVFYSELCFFLQTMIKNHVEKICRYLCFSSGIWGRAGVPERRIRKRRVRVEEGRRKKKKKE